jgi:hypothetical protein
MPIAVAPTTINKIMTVRLACVRTSIRVTPIVNPGTESAERPAGYTSPRTLRHRAVIEQGPGGNR